MIDISYIESQIQELIRQIRPDVDTMKLKRNEWLTGEEYKFSALDLMYLYFEIEQKFNIILDANNLRNYEFATMNGIVRVVRKAL